MFYSAATGVGDAPGVEWELFGSEGPPCRERDCGKLLGLRHEPIEWIRIKIAH